VQHFWSRSACVIAGGRASERPICVRASELPRRAQPFLHASRLVDLCMETHGRMETRALVDLCMETPKAGHRVPHPVDPRSLPH
jgi:hypothetical protein